MIEFVFAVSWKEASDWSVFYEKGTNFLHVILHRHNATTALQVNHIDSDEFPMHLCVITDSSGGHHGNESGEHECKLAAAAIDWDHVESPYIIAAFLFCSALLKIGELIPHGI